METLLPLQGCLNGKKGDCNQTTPSQDGVSTSPPSEGKLGWAAGSDRPPIHTKAGWWPSGYNWSQLTYLCNCGNLCQVAFLKLVSCREPVSLLFQAVCAAGTNSEGTPERSISVLFSPWRYCTHKAGGYVSRLIYLFYFGLGKKKKKNYANWGRHVLCFPAEPAASPVASMLWRSTRGRGRLQVLNFVMLL